MTGSSLLPRAASMLRVYSIDFLLTGTTPWFSSHAGRFFHLVSDYSTVTVTGSLFKRLSAYSFHCIRSNIFLLVFTTFVYFPSLEFVLSYIHCIPSFT